MQFPHCDARVLHAPGDCQFCDGHEDWQQLRETWGINFTGQYDPTKLLCPAEQHRRLTTIDKWGGNVASPHPHDPSEQRVRAVIEEATHLLRRLRPS
jgi:hypothetical protein